MTLLPIVLSVLAAWALLGVLAVGLLLIVKSLQSVRGWFQQITVGVRAVEQQTQNLDARAGALSDCLRGAIGALHSAARAMEAVNREGG